MADKQKRTTKSKIDEFNEKLSDPYLMNTELDRAPFRTIDDLVLSRASGEKLEAYQRALREQARGTNFAIDPSRYVLKGTTLFPYTDRLNARGFVADAAPTRVHVESSHSNNPEQVKHQLTGWANTPEMEAAYQRILDKPLVNTLAHESTHARQNMHGLPAIMSEKEKALYDKIHDQFVANTTVDTEGVNIFRGSGADPKELGAYVTGYESLYPPADSTSGVKQLIPIQNTYLGRRIIPERAPSGIGEILKQIFGSDLGRDPAGLEMLYKMMGRKTVE